jgi:hypothetical protein
VAAILFGFGLFVSLSAHSHHPPASAGTRCTLLRWCRGCLGAVLMAAATSALRKGARPLHDAASAKLTAKAERRKRRKAAKAAAASVEPTNATEAPEPPSAPDTSPEMEVEPAAPDTQALATGAAARRRRAWCPTAQEPSTINNYHGCHRRRLRSSSPRRRSDLAAAVVATAATRAAARGAAATGGGERRGQLPGRCPRPPRRAPAPGGGLRQPSRVSVRPAWVAAMCGPLPEKIRGLAGVSRAHFRARA